MIDRLKYNLLVFCIKDILNTDFLDILKTKQSYKDIYDHPEWIWNSVVICIATMRNSRGIKLIYNKGFPNNPKYYYSSLVLNSDADNKIILEDLLKGVRFEKNKIEYLLENIKKIKKIGGPSAVKDSLLKLKTAGERINLIQDFSGIGPKYSLTILIDAGDDIVSNIVVIDYYSATFINFIDSSLSRNPVKKTYLEYEKNFRQIACDVDVDIRTLDIIMHRYYEKICQKLNIG